MENFVGAYFYFLHALSDASCHILIRDNLLDMLTAPSLMTCVACVRMSQKNKPRVCIGYLSYARCCRWPLSGLHAKVVCARRGCHDWQRDPPVHWRVLAV